MKLRITFRYKEPFGLPMVMHSDQWLIDSDGALNCIVAGVVANKFYNWEKIEAMPDA